MLVCASHFHVPSMSSGQKRPSTSNLQNDIKRIMSAAQEREFQFVCDHLKANPQMASMAAELIRDGSLERILSGEALQQQKDITTRLLPAALRKWRHLKSPVALRILRALLGREKHEEFMLAVQEDTSPNSSLEVNLVKWALGVENDDALPCRYSNWRVEETFIKMCEVRYEQMGRRLDDGWAPSKPKVYGYYQLADDSPQFTCAGLGDKCKGKVFELPLSKKVLSQGSFEVENNFSPHAVLVTRNGVRVKLLDCVTDEVEITDMALPSPEWKLDTVRLPLAADVASPTGTSSIATASVTGGNDASTVSAPASGGVVPAGNGHVRAAPVQD